MSYIATMVACMLGKSTPTADFITTTGSAHGANNLFPDTFHNGSNNKITHKPNSLTMEEWDAWYSNIISMYSSPAIIKDSWVKFGTDNWNTALSKTDCLVLVASAETELDVMYSWFNMVSKIPRHLYRVLMHKSVYHPILWHKLNKQQRIKALTSAMPAYTTTSFTVENRPLLSFKTVDILEINFPDRVGTFLENNGYKVKWAGVHLFHKLFVSKQIQTLDLARYVVAGGQIIPRGPFDTILLNYLSRPAE